MKRRTIIISIIVLAGLFGIYVILRNLGLFSGAVSSGIIERKIIDRPERVEIIIDENAQFSYHMDLIMSGKINGKGVLCIEWTDSICLQKDTISNDFSVKYKGDWYCDNCIIYYTPITATKGGLTIDYTIFGSKK